MAPLHRSIPLAAALLCFVTVAAASLDSAHAHDFEPQREVLVQVFDAHVDVMIVYTEAPGGRTHIFNSRYGLALEDDESSELAALAMLPRMLDGLQFEIDGEQPRTGEPEVKIDHQGDHLRAAAYVRYELDELDEGEQRSVIVRSVDGPFLPTNLVFYGSDGIEPVSANVPRSQSLDQAHQIRLFRDDERRVTFQRR